MDMLKLDVVSPRKCVPVPSVKENRTTESVTKMTPDKKLLEVFPQTSPVISKNSNICSRRFLRELLATIAKKPICTVLDPSKQCSSREYNTSPTGNIKKSLQKHDDLLEKLVKDSLTEEQEKYRAVISEMQRSFESGLDDPTSTVTAASALDPNESTGEEMSSTSEICTFIEGVLPKACSTQIESSYFHLGTLDSSKVSFQTDISEQSHPASSLLSSKKMSCPNFMTLCMSSTSITKMIEDISNTDAKNKDQRLYVEIKIAKQLLDFLNYGQDHMRDFIGGAAHLEAERILVLTETKIEILLASKNSQKYIQHDYTTEVTLTNLKCHINSYEPAISSKIYYVLVISHHETVYATRIMRPDNVGCIEFPGTYTYKSNSMESIKAELFCVRLNTTSKRTLKRLFGKKPAHNFKVPLMTYYGEVSIEVRPTNRGHYIFNKPGDSVKPDILSASVSVKDNPTSKIRRYSTLTFEQTTEEHSQNDMETVGVSVRKDRMYYTYPPRKLNF